MSRIITFPQVRHTRRQAGSAAPLSAATSRAVAGAYDHVGQDYGRYADGEALDEPAAGASRFAHADAIVWETIIQAIDLLRAGGAANIRVLDAGCGPGTWIKRIAGYANRKGLGVEAVGIDISSAQLEIARRHSGNCEARDPNVRRHIEFATHDLADPLPWPGGHFHIVVCNYVVLNHLTRSTVARAVGELCRVASHRVIATVRAVASPPTGCIVGTEQVRDYRQDCGRGELALVLQDGTRHRLTFNVYTAEALKALFAAHAAVVDLRAIDLFLSRFAPEARWTAKLVNGLSGRQDVVRKLKELEEPLCRLPGWVDHGTHVLIVAQPRNAARTRAV